MSSGFEQPATTVDYQIRETPFKCGRVGQLCWRLQGFEVHVSISKAADEGEPVVEETRAAFKLRFVATYDVEAGQLAWPMLSGVMKLDRAWSRRKRLRVQACQHVICVVRRDMNSESWHVCSQIANEMGVDRLVLGVARQLPAALIPWETLYSRCCTQMWTLEFMKTWIPRQGLGVALDLVSMCKKIISRVAYFTECY